MPKENTENVESFASCLTASDRDINDTSIQERRPAGLMSHTGRCHAGATGRY